jgi:hypothetical protein
VKWGCRHACAFVASGISGKFLNTLAVGWRWQCLRNPPVTKIALSLALLLGAAIVLPVVGASPADAQANCRYTSGDKAKGYRC